jgi:hypothetical protein
MKKLLGIVILITSFGCLAQNAGLNYPNYIFLIFGAPQGEQTNLIQLGAQTRTIVAHDNARATCTRQRPNDNPYKVSFSAIDLASNSNFEFDFENSNQQPLKVGSKIGVQGILTFWKILGNQWRVTNLNMVVTEIGTNFVVAKAHAGIDQNGIYSKPGTVHPNSGSAAGRADILKSEIRISCN